jgi:hypothetical protein
MSLEGALKAFGIHPQLVCDNSDLIWFEREVNGARWFFVAAPVGGGYHGTVRLSPGISRGWNQICAEWWDPVDGSIRPLAVRRKGRFCEVRLDLLRAESGFVVLRRGSASAMNHLRDKENAQDDRSCASSGQIHVTDWTVRFPAGWGAPAEPVPLATLRPWKDMGLGAEASAFSGTATYESSFVIPEGQERMDWILDLGEVDFIADVCVNGQSAGVRWMPPYRFSISSLIQEGVNTLTVEVTSTWYNRLVYDAGLPESKRKTWTISGPKAGAPLHNSGLLGPVSILSE